MMLHWPYYILHDLIISLITGNIPLTDFDDENVLALHSSPDDQYLLAGDTAGYITVYDIQNYCTVPQEVSILISLYLDDIIN